MPQVARIGRRIVSEAFASRDGRRERHCVYSCSLDLPRNGRTAMTCINHLILASALNSTDLFEVGEGC